MNEYLGLLRESFMKNNSVVCFGMDPEIDRMRFRSMDRLYMRIAGYFIEIMEGIRDRISAVKPNIGYYLRYGEEGLKALNEILKKARDFSLPIILDIKAGDIGKTSKAYAEFAFKQLKVDAVTLNPYLGIGALTPFFEYREKGFYILTLTSNPEAREIEYLLTEGGKKVYEHVFSSVIELNRKNPGAGIWRSLDFNFDFLFFSFALYYFYSSKKFSTDFFDKKDTGRKKESVRRIRKTKKAI